MSTPGKIEIRGEVDEDSPWVACVDAHIKSDPARPGRMQIIDEVMSQWAEREFNKATLVVRLMRGNGSMSDA